jgi:hypothetical protein
MPNSWAVHPHTVHVSLTLHCAVLIFSHHPPGKGKGKGAVVEEPAKGKGKGVEVEATKAPKVSRRI